MCLQYVNLVKTVSDELEMDLSGKLLQRLTDAPVGAARDALNQQRRETVRLVKESLGKVKDDVRRKSETIERSDISLNQLRCVCLCYSRLLFTLFVDTFFRFVKHLYEKLYQSASADKINQP